MGGMTAVTQEDAVQTVTSCPKSERSDRLVKAGVLHLLQDIAFNVLVHRTDCEGMLRRIKSNHKKTQFSSMRREASRMS